MKTLEIKIVPHADGSLSVHLNRLVQRSIHGLLLVAAGVSMALWLWLKVSIFLAPGLLLLALAVISRLTNLNLHSGQGNHFEFDRPHDSLRCDGQTISALSEIKQVVLQRSRELVAQRLTSNNNQTNLRLFLVLDNGNTMTMVQAVVAGAKFGSLVLFDGTTVALARATVTAAQPLSTGVESSAFARADDLTSAVNSTAEAVADYLGLAVTLSENALRA